MRGLVDDKQMERAREMVSELLADIEHRVLLKIDRDFVHRAYKYLDDTGSFAFARRLTVAEWDRLAAVHSQYIASRNKRKETPHE